MDFGFSSEEELFRKSVSEFCKRYLEPRWVEIDEGRRIPVDLIERMGKQGLFAIPVSEEYGGMGGSVTMCVIAVEEIAYHDPSVATAVYTLLNNAWPFILYLHGSEEAKSEILPEVGKGRAFFGIASTEPQGGSDVGGIQTTAVRKGDVWVVNGEKVYISGIREALELPCGGCWMLIARTGRPEDRHRGLTTFVLVPRWNGKLKEGFKHTIFESVGRHGISTGGMTLENFTIEDKYRVGEVNRGFYVAMEGFNVARIMVAAACVGTARWALDRALEWIRERKLFGRSIASFQGISFRFAELYAELEAARLLVYRAAWVADKIYVERAPGYRPTDLNVPAAMAKMKAPEVAVRVYEETLKWLGAYGYMKESNVFRGWLGAFSYVIGAEGAQNIMRYIVARDVIGREYVGG